MRMLSVLTIVVASACVHRVAPSSPPPLEQYRRPSAEWLSLSMAGAKVGWMHSTFERASTWEGQPAIITRDELVMRVAESELTTATQFVWNPRTGELIAQTGLEGDTTTVCRCLADHAELTTRRPNQPDRVERLAACAATFAEADVRRLAFSQRGHASGTTREGGRTERVETADYVDDVTIDGVKASRVRTTEGEFAYAIDDGRLLKAIYGPMSAVVSTEALAKDIGKGLPLSGMSLPRPLRPGAKSAEFTFIHANEKAFRDIEGRQTVSTEGEKVIVEVRTQTVKTRSAVDAAWRSSPGLMYEFDETPTGDFTAPSFAARVKAATSKGGDAWELAKALLVMTAAIDVKPGVLVTPASEVLTRGEGTRTDLANVFIAAARSIGIPARPVTGLVEVRGTMYAGVWAEVFVGEWIQVDPLDGPDFIVGTNHLQVEAPFLIELTLSGTIVSIE